ncbi:hypothetical protein IFM89_035509 [Coptis chinensis]|uniref:Uncharacterized protein n=1 Tax=Coptis chinensis TaxID=261450 RepID=A0A835LKH7_9MAGN|nr:hypothetical protein IFM89_035509 [Coptis chinensis]
MVESREEDSQTTIDDVAVYLNDEEEEERDLLFEMSDREDNVLQFLLALDLQVLGACRADERLTPLLKTNVSNCAAEDRLLANLIQHFEAHEIGMLARCLCMPLVSIRVGKIIKQRNLFCPTSVRGNLNLALLPSSNLRISFVGDDGCSERLATISSNCKNSAVSIEDIPADTSGRSFVLNLLSNQAYFWCSEKSKLLGNDLLVKMNDLVERRPSLAELTGIAESRLDCFAVHFHEYLVGSTVSKLQTIHISAPITSTDTAPEPSELDSSDQSSLSKLSFPQLSSSDSLKDSVIDSCCLPSVSMLVDANISSTNNQMPAEGSIPSSSSLAFLESRGIGATPSAITQLLEGLPSSKDLTGGSYLFPPYYCSCPPCTSTPIFAELPANVTNSFADCFPLPPLSTLLSANGSRNSFAPLKPPNLLDVTPLDFSTFLSDPVVQLPLSISLATVTSSQQIPTFTPLMFDPIVHIPAIGVCSSGQGYLVGAGRAVPATIPLRSHLVNPSIPDSESMAEKGARDTLQLLLSSAQTHPWSRDLPAVLTSAVNSLDHDMLDAGSQNKCSGKTDVDALANSISAMEFVSLAHWASTRRQDGDLDSSSKSEVSEGLKDYHSADVNKDAVG